MELLSLCFILIMAKTAHYYTKFEEGEFYHIYNRTVDKQLMFKNEDNYLFFLNKYDEYLSAFVDTYAYCLLGNHFHMLVRIKEAISFQKQSNLINYILPNSVKTTHDIVSHQFRKFFQSYSMAFNKQHERVGTLFQTPFKRAYLENDAYFTSLIYYIHANPQNHGLIGDFREWKWSSYHTILSDKPSKLKKQEVINWFYDIETYKKYHDDIHINLKKNALDLDEM